MIADPTVTDLTPKHPINIGSKAFVQNKYAYYQWLLENEPVYKGKLAVLNAYFITRYDDCVAMLKDPRFVRNRATATGKGGRFPFPLPKSVKLIAESMILEDDPGHARLRGLVHQAFTPTAVRKLSGGIETMTHKLLDKAESESRANGSVDLMPAYSLPIPVTVISDMMGVTAEETGEFSTGIRALTDGLTGLSIVRTMAIDLPKTTKYMRTLIAKKRKNPGDDIFTGLINAEEDGEKLSEDELIAMAYLLILAGFETTVHLINNVVITLLQHPEQLQLLRDNTELMDSAIEEVLRFNGPIQGTKPAYAKEDVVIGGVTIPRGATVMPLLGAANRDPEKFENPNVFDITREKNQHLGFGQGIHYCLGAPLARMETKIALTNLIERNPNMRLAIDPNELKIQQLPAWHRYESVPVILG